MLGAMNLEGSGMSVKLDRLLIRSAMASGLSLSLSLPLATVAGVSTAMVVSATAPSLAEETASAAAHSNQPMKLLKLSVSGNQRVPAADIDSAITVRVGQKVTRADLQATLN